MRRPRLFETLGAGLVLAAAGLVTPAAVADDGAGPVPDEAVLTSDFEDGDASPWVGRGSAAVAVVDDGHESGRSLEVTGRTADWHGTQTEVSALLEPTGTYAVSAWVKLSEPGETTVKLTVAETPEAYTQVTDAATVTADEWVELTGTYTFAAGLTGAALYVEAADPEASFLVDDVSVVGPPLGSIPDFVPGGAVDPTPLPVERAQGEGDVAALTFDDGPNTGGETAELLDFLAANDITAVFCVVGDRIQADGGAELLRRIVDEGHVLCNHSTSFDDMGSYTAAQAEADLKETLAIIRDALGDPEAPVPYFRAPNGSWGVTGQVAADLGMQPLGLGNLIFDWDGEDQSLETLTANMRAAVTPGAVVLAHDGPANRANTIAAVTTVVTERLAEGWEFTLPQERGPEPPSGDDTVVTSLDFDDESIDPWTQSGNPTLAFVDEGDGKALSITRAADYEGIQSPTGILEPGSVYTLSMRARLPEGSPVESTGVRFVVKPAYDWVGDATIDASGWTEIEGAFTVPADADPAELQVYIGSTDQAVGAYEILVDDVRITTPSGGGGTPVDETFDFEDGTLQGWVARDAGGSPTAAVTDAEAHGGTYAAQVSDRAGQGDGLGYDFTGTFEPGVAYEVTAWVKMAAGEEADEITLSVQRGESTFDNVETVDAVGDTEWVQLSTTYTYPGGDLAFLYFETNYSTGGPGSFLVDDITVRSADDPEVQDLTPLKDTVDVPLGVAIDSRETLGAPAELTLRHFDQITAENHMKVEAWYDENRTFRVHPEAAALMDFAAANDLRVYGHVLLWHSQTPEWFFQDEAGEPLTDSAEDQQLLRDRLRTHVFDVAEALSAWGEYGGDNPLVAWDVVNEVVSDSAEFSDGLRRSEWYRILGEEFIDLAFEYADEAFNAEYAAEGTDRPVALFINDYNTEQGGKQNRYLALVERMLDRGVPLDGVGHQFHVSLSMPVSALEGTIERFADLPVTQAVTELDVTVGTPVTDANLVEQGYYYRDAFRVFREHADELYSVTVWGLTDSRSWRSAQAPLLFDGGLQAKPAYYGAADTELPDRLLGALVFQGSVPLDDDATSTRVWQELPLNRVGEVAGFQARWEADHLTVLVDVTDGTDEATDGLELVLDGTTYAFGRDGEGDVEGVTAETDEGWRAVVHLPLDGAAQGDGLAFNLRVTDGEQQAGWAGADGSGDLTLVEPLSVTEVVEATAAPEVDGVVDDVWADANAVVTGTLVEGAEDGATAEVRTLWSGDGSTLYVLAEVTDDQIDVSASDPWVQDSVEIFVDAGNHRAGPYRADDTQIRISAENVVSFGTGDEAAQEARLVSATATTDGGYLVEAAISLLEEGGPGTFHGLDVQVNDGTDGARTSVRTWADPTGLSYQNTSRWGVAQLVEGVDEPEPPVLDPTLKIWPPVVMAGGDADVRLTGWAPGTEVEITLVQERSGWFLGKKKAVVVELGTVTIGADGTGSATLDVPRGTKIGLYDLVATQGDLRDEKTVLVTPYIPPVVCRIPILSWFLPGC